MSRESGYSETEIVGTLTDDEGVPLEVCFVLRKCIYFWNAEQAICHAYLLDKDVADACRDFLRSKGQAFSRSKDVAAWAQSHNWPSLRYLCL
jgi:hypothetical protein